MYSDQDLDDLSPEQLAHLLEALEAGNAAVPPPQNAFRQMPQYPTASYPYNQPPVLQHSFSNDPTASFNPQVAFSNSRQSTPSFSSSRPRPIAVDTSRMPVPFGTSYQRQQLQNPYAHQNMQNQQHFYPRPQQQPASFNNYDHPVNQRPIPPNFSNSAVRQREEFNDENVPPPSVTSNAAPKQRHHDHDLMAHEMTTDHKYPLHVNTGITTQFDSAQKNPVSGAQKNGVCTRIAKVKEIVINKAAVDFTLDDDIKVNSLKNFKQFFIDYEADVSLTVISNDYKLCENFFDSCSNLRLWATDVGSITVQGHFTKKTISMFTKATSSENAVYRLFKVKLSSDDYTFTDWLSDIQQAFSIVADASCFPGSTYFDDCAAAAKWLNESKLHPTSITVFTRSMCGPLALEELIQKHVSLLANGDTLNCYTTAPLYSEISAKLQQDHQYIPGPPLTLLDDFPKISASFTYKDDNFCSNFWFSGSN